MKPIYQHLRNMALNPKKQLKQLLIGTFGSFVSLVVLVVMSNSLNQWSFYLLVTIAGCFMLYAIPGYVGIWLWRMRKFFFDLD